MKQFTIVYLQKGDLVILAEKKHKIGAGRLNGYGGGIKIGESPIKCAIRELREESGVAVDLQNMKFISVMCFLNDQAKELSRCFVFIAKEWRGDPVEGEEMGPPQEFSIKNLPFSRMMVGDELWVPRVFTGKKFIGVIRYDEDHKAVIDSEFVPLKA